jgi:hypothetical protein
MIMIITITQKTITDKATNESFKIYPIQRSKFSILRYMNVMY